MEGHYGVYQYECVHECCRRVLSPSPGKGIRSPASETLRTSSSGSGKCTLALAEPSMMIPRACARAHRPTWGRRAGAAPHCQALRHPRTQRGVSVRQYSLPRPPTHHSWGRYYPARPKELQGPGSSEGGGREGGGTVTVGEAGGLRETDVGMESSRNCSIVDGRIPVH